MLIINPTFSIANVLPSFNKEINSFTYLLTLSSEFKKLIKLCSIYI